MNGLALDISPEWADAERSEMTLLETIRAELRRSYPRLNVRRLMRLVRDSGRDSMPAGLLVSGEIAGAGGAQKALSTMRRNPLAHTHPLFDGYFYRAKYPDVAAANVSPWLHYQVFGRKEGRSPHPLIDPGLLAKQLPHVEADRAVDEYLRNPLLWTTSPSPYVDVASFVVHGPWDRRQHPLVQILRSFAGPPWVRKDLMMIDAGRDEDSAADLLLRLTLLDSSGASRGIGVILEKWAEGDPILNDTSEVRVVPGRLVGAEGVFRMLENGPYGWLPDRTGRVSPRGAVFVRPSSVVRSTSHLIIDGRVPHSAISSAVASLPRPLVISPPTMSVFGVLSAQVGESVEVLKPGRQYVVEADQHVRVHGELLVDSLLSSRGLDIDEGPRTAVVLARGEYAKWSGSPLVRESLRGGAHLCLVGGEDFFPWLATLERSRTVMATRAMLEEMVPIIDLENRNLVALTDS